MISSLFTIRLSNYQIDIHQRLSEWHLMLVMFLSGLVFLFFDTFHLPPFMLVKEIAPSWAWGLVMTFIGISRFVVLYINGRWSRTPHLRSFLAVLSSIVWMGLLTSLMAYSTPLLVGPFIFAAIVVEQISAFRAAQDARAVDESGANDGTSG